jgi:PhzF family phenazine biosynthesis protein
MKLTLYQIDAFTNKLFSGNPAAVVPLEKWLDADMMQQLAMENNLAETAFFAPSVIDGKVQDAAFEIRWFTPEAEINLCGHATLASAYVLFNILGHDVPKLVFHSKSGPLYITRKDNLILLDFPSWMPEKIDEYPQEALDAIGNPEIAGVYRHRDLLIELTNEEAVRKLQPDFAKLKKTGMKLIVTAPGKDVDFVSRFFAPTVGINEDPVTGSAHSQLIPFWSYKLGKNTLRAKQLSKRGGDLWCEQKGERVVMGGECVYYMKGEFSI